MVQTMKQKGVAASQSRGRLTEAIRISDQEIAIDGFIHKSQIVLPIFRSNSRA